MNFLRMKLTVGLATVGLFAVLAPTSSATIIPIGNSSFEAALHAPISVDPILGNYSHDFFDPTPGASQWLLGPASTGGEYIPMVGPVANPGMTVYNSLAPLQAGQATQNQVLYLDTGIVSQILTTTIAPNLIYTLTFYQGERLEKDQEPNFTYSLGVISGGVFVPLVQQQVSGFLFNSPGHPGSPSGAFAPLQLTFDSGSLGNSPLLNGTTQLAIQINNQGSSIGGLAQLDLDNFSLDAIPNPEPASLTLMGLGIAAVVISRKRVSSSR